MSIAVRRVAGDDPVAVRLVAAMAAEITELYDAPPGLPAPPRELSPPDGGFVILERDATPVAGGGIKRLDAGACEIKRMYVLPEARGSGLGKRLLAELEALARDLGYAVARLDTGDRQPEARQLFERAGYAAIPDYNGNRMAAFWGEKRLGRQA